LKRVAIYPRHRLQKLNRRRAVGGFALTVNFNHLANDPARNPGRPRKKRIQTGGEVGGNAAKAPKYHCSRCKEGPQRRGLIYSTV
jgi:hypothetical protein